MLTKISDRGNISAEVRPACSAVVHLAKWHLHGCLT